MKKLPVHLIPTDKAFLPPEAERERPDRVADDILSKSIEKGGIQQPLVVLFEGGRFRIVEGGRRWKIAKVLGIPKIPAVIDSVPDGQNPDSYARRIRFMLDTHRQDLLPSQKAELITKLRQQMGLSNAQVAAYLGVDADSVTNWLAVQRYIPEVVERMDAGRITMRAARIFDGMSEVGQKEMLKRHGKAIENATGDAHRAFRRLFPPDKCPGFYVDPDRAKKRLAVKQKPKRGAPRPNYTQDEKKRLMGSLDVKAAELETLKDEMRQAKKECVAAGPIVAAILRNPKLRKLVTPEMEEELEAFARVY